MTEILRNRTIRPSTRLEKSKNYKIDTKLVTRSDILVVNIYHESKSFKKTYTFYGADIAHRDSISFRVSDSGLSIDIIWAGAQPIDAIGENAFSKAKPKSKDEMPAIKANQTSLKTSFNPISNQKTTVLILGTIPGDKSLELGEYYGQSGNRFWKIISAITKNELPKNYDEKKSLLEKSKIGIWDVAHKANRKGSLDSAIKNEEPNDLESFIESHKSLRIIGFNGAKSKALFDKYFTRKKGIDYITLPSTSPANTGISFDALCKIWQQICNI